MKKYAEITRDNRMWDAQKTIYGNAAWVKLPDCGTATVIWGENEEGYEHVSVCPKKKYDKLGRENLPTWNDMCILKDMFFMMMKRYTRSILKRINMLIKWRIAYIFGSQSDLI